MMNATIKHTSRRIGRRTRAGLVATAAMFVASIPVAVQASGGDRNDAVRNDAVVVANRASGDISVIDADSFDVATIDLPGNAEPMYVSHDRRHHRVFVGDRASSSIIALDDETYEVVGSTDVGDGVFHQWLDVQRRQLWVVGDTSRSVTVVDSRHLQPITTIDIPADLVGAGGAPHDVFVSGRHAFVSILGLDDGSGVVLQYSTRTFEETGRIVTGADPHLFVQHGRLFVASQGGSVVSGYRARNLRPLGSIDVPSAHGIYVTNRGEVLVTNIAGGGVDAVWELNRRLTSVVDVVDTSVSTPHNLTVDKDRHVYVTHSGATADQVSVIDLDRHGFGSVATVTVGMNPFGLAFVRG